MNNEKDEATQKLNITAGIDIPELKSLEERKEPQVFRIKLYKRRWVIMMLFSLFSSGCYTQWIEYTIIENVIARYYQVSSLAVEWTGIVYMVSYGILLLPVSYMLHKLDLRKSCIIAAFVMSLGTWIKVFSISRNRFYVALIGQTIVASCHIIVSSVPASLAAYWFGSGEIATAIATGNNGLTIISAFFTVLVPKVVKNHENVEDIGNDLYTLMLSMAVLNTIVFVGILICNEPKFPPSKSRALQKLYRKGEFEFFRPLWHVLKEKNFILLWHAFGLNGGYVNAMFTVLNPLYLAHFQNGEEDAGRIAMVMMFSGSIGVTLFGRIQDKLKKFKETMIVLYVGTILGEILFAVSFYLDSKWGVYIASSVLGFFSFSYFTSGFETCAEITYPESEGICMAFLCLSNQIYGAILSVTLNKLMENYGDMEAHFCMLSVLLVGFILTLFMDNVQKRQAAVKVDITGMYTVK